MARRRGIHLHARDLAVLETLAVRRAETLPWLHNQLFAGLSRKRARNRLGDLVAHGYLTKITQPDLGEHDHAPQRSGAVYLLGPRAPAALKLRSLTGEQLHGRRALPTLRDTSVPHQLAVNRVGDALGVQLIPEHALELRGVEHRHRPDGAYRSHPDELGRDLVFVEVDLGHYSRARLLGKLRAFLDHGDARSILIAAPTEQRAELIAQWARERYGNHVIDRVQLFTIAELHAGARLAPGTEPAGRRPTTTAATW